MRLALLEKDLKGVKASSRGPVISHLLFVDDCILFGEALSGVVNVLKRILKEHEVNSGQFINFNKSSMFFNVNVRMETRIALSTRLGVRFSNNSKKYLRLPNMVSHQK